jgi:LmbE family N-acetylglucosaminyl deacetylase
LITLDLSRSGPLRIALLGAHCDDIEIGCGGMLLDLAGRGALEAVDALVVASSPEREEETRIALPAFCDPAPTALRFGGLRDGRLPAHWDQVKDLLQDWARDSTADVVLAPSPSDAHQDHRLLGEMVRTAFRDHVVLHYEIPKWDGDLGATRPTVYWPLERDVVERKYQLLERYYPSQTGHDWFRPDTFSALSRLRGMECRHDHAEAFGCPALVLGVVPRSRESAHQGHDLGGVST